MPTHIDSKKSSTKKSRGKKSRTKKSRGKKSIRKSLKPCKYGQKPSPNIYPPACKKV